MYKREEHDERNPRLLGGEEGFHLVDIYINMNFVSVK